MKKLSLLIFTLFSVQTFAHDLSCAVYQIEQGDITIFSQIAQKADTTGGGIEIDVKQVDRDIKFVSYIVSEVQIPDGSSTDLSNHHNSEYLTMKVLEQVEGSLIELYSQKRSVKNLRSMTIDDGHGNLIFQCRVADSEIN